MPFLKNLKTTELENYTKAILPFGATEQHGPFLPLGTDSVIMEGILVEIEKGYSQLVILPNIEITCSQEHAGFTGTMWVSQKTMQAYLVDILNSISNTFDEIYFITSHGGNVEFLSRFAEENKVFAGMNIYYINTEVEEIDSVLRQELQGEIDEHAGNLEISTMLYLEEDLVDVPPSNYPKTTIAMNWSKPVIVQSKTGIVDNNPQWIISKELGKKFVEMSAEYIIKQIKFPS